jgi:hypothetical protein
LNKKAKEGGRRRLLTKKKLVNCNMTCCSIRLLRGLRIVAVSVVLLSLHEYNWVVYVAERWFGVRDRTKFGFDDAPNTPPSMNTKFL